MSGSAAWSAVAGGSLTVAFGLMVAVPSMCRAWVDDLDHRLTHPQNGDTPETVQADYTRGAKGAQYFLVGCLAICMVCFWWSVGRLAGGEPLAVAVVLGLVAICVGAAHSYSVHGVINRLGERIAKASEQEKARAGADDKTTPPSGKKEPGAQRPEHPRH